MGYLSVAVGRSQEEMQLMTWPVINLLVSSYKSPKHRQPKAYVIVTYNNNI